MRETTIFFCLIKIAFNIHLLNRSFLVCLKVFFIQPSNLHQELFCPVIPFLWNAPEIPSPGWVDHIRGVDSFAVSANYRPPDSSLYLTMKSYRNSKSDLFQDSLMHSLFNHLLAHTMYQALCQALGV